MSKVQIRRSLHLSICILAAVTLFGLGLGVEANAQQQRRIPGEKMTLDQLRAMPKTDQVVVKFREGEKVRLSGQRLTGLRSGQANSLDRVLAEAGVSGEAMKPLHDAPPEELEKEKDDAQRSSGRQLADLSLYFVIDVPPGTSAAEFAAKLNGLAFVEFARPALKPAPPPVYIVPKRAEPPENEALRRGSPDFSSMQTYKSDRGVGPIPSVPGSDGRGVAYVDIEYGWQLGHEDLSSPPIENLDGFSSVHPSDPESNHGTSVLGIISGNPNAYGVTGIAPGATAMVSSAMDQLGYYQPARAIVQAARRLRPGDVIIIEQQIGVCGTENELGPLEYYQDIFDAVASATAKGVIVLAAAGNGRDNQGPGYNLDSVACQGVFDRRLSDSQAIIVGAGSSVDRSKLYFSTFGSRVDVQGWGEYVTTTGYGDAYNPGNDPRRYYTNFFSGTSSATPIVAGTVLIIQGVRKACGLPPLRPREMRNLLVRTGLRQGQPRSTHIGPLPNLAAALRASVPAACLKGRDQPQPVSEPAD